MPVSCHILVEGNPAIIYASRNGHPEKVLPRLRPFLAKFWQERDIAGESRDTPECLVAQIIVCFGFQICEDDFSNLRVGVNYFLPEVEYLYTVGSDRQLRVWVPEAAYRAEPTLGLAGCREVV